MKKTALILAAVASLGAVSANAMSEELTQLEAAIERSFQSLGIEDIHHGDLSLSKLELIKRVIEGDDNNNEKKNRIMAIIER